MKKILVKSIGLFLLIPFTAYSAGAEFSPQVIFFQLLNFSVFLFLFFFLLRKPVKTFFHRRQKEFFAFEEQALNLEKEKQQQKKLWDSKLFDLTEKEKNIKEQAKKEGERFKSQKKKELKELSESLKKTSAFLLSLEKEKLKRESFKYWKAQLVEKTRTELNNQALSKDFQKKEQKGFLNLLKLKKLNEKNVV